MSEKTCAACHATKPLTEFHRNGDRNHLKRCKVCQNARNKIRRDANPELHRARNRACYWRNPEWRAVRLAKHREYRAANRERFIQDGRAYYARNAEHYRQYARDKRASKKAERLAQEQANREHAIQLAAADAFVKQRLAEIEWKLANPAPKQARKPVNESEMDGISAGAFAAA